MAALIEFDLTQVEAGFARMLSQAKDLKKVWRKVRPGFRKLQKQHIAKQSGPNGPWQRLAASTRERRMSQGSRAGKFTKRGKLRKSAQRKLGRILSRKLLNKAKVKIERLAISITAVGPLPGVHQHGAITGKGSRIPARPFLFVDDPFALQVIGLISEALRDAWEKKRI